MKAPEGTFWIGPAHPFDLREVYLNFRADVSLAAAPTRAVLRLSADSRYRLWVNGSFVGRGPERSWPSSMAVDERDVTGLLRAGVNRIAVQVYSPGHSHFAYVHRGACGLLAWLEADGTALLRSGPGWRVKRDLSWSDRVPRVSIYGAGVEDLDMALAEDWTEADPQYMEEARLVQGADGPIWLGLRPRATPLPVEELLPLEAPCQIGVGPRLVPSPDPHADLRSIFERSRFLQRNRAEASAGFDAEFPKVPRPEGPGDTRIWIFDLGESRSCIAGGEIIARGGETLLVSYSERLREGAILLSDPASYCRMRPTDRFALRPGRQRVEGFTPRGARYLIFALECGTNAPEPTFFARLPSYPLEERPVPPQDDPVLGAVAAICRRTTLACLQDGFVDGVWRENSLWLGDAVAQDWALRAISDDPRPLLFTIEMAAEGADGQGLLPSVLPSEVPAYSVTDYNFGWVELLAGCTDHPGIGDPEPTWQRHWATLRGLLISMAGHRGADGLLRNPPGRRLFLDWSTMDRAEPNLTLNLRYLHALRLASEMAERIGAAEGAAWRAEAESLSKAIQSFNTPEGWRESPLGCVASQLGLAFLIRTGLVEGEEAAAICDRIVACSMDPSDPPLAGQPALASPFMHHYIFLALDSWGRSGDILAIIAARWGRWTQHGHATTPENWSIDFPDGSACHGFSAHALGWIARLSSHKR